jgi:hypothetical protein
MMGSASQSEWAEQIKPPVNSEFDRVAKAFQSAASNQTGQDRVDTLAIIAILDEKRVKVMGKDQAGYFIRELAGTERLGAPDYRRRSPVYREIKDQRAARRQTTIAANSTSQRLRVS